MSENLPKKDPQKNPEFITPEEIEKLDKILTSEEKKEQEDRENLNNLLDEELVQNKTEKDLLENLNNAGIAYKFPEENESLIISFFETQEKEIKEILYTLKMKIEENNNQDCKKLLFVYSVLKAQKDVADTFFKLFKSKLLDVSLANDFVFSDKTREPIRNNNEVIGIALKICAYGGYSALAIEILNSSNYTKIDDEIIKIAVDSEIFSFLGALLKKSKDNLRNQALKVISTKSSRFSQMQSYKTQFLNSLSITIQNALERKTFFWQEHDKANDLIQKLVLKREEKIAIKLLIHYFIKFNRNYLKYSILDFAISNDCFILVKKYFDLYPRTRYRVRDYSAISKIIEILDEDENFIHGVFLLSKVNPRTLNEIHVRMIIDKYWLFLRDKLFLITYCVNPILICVMIIENLKSLSKFYMNVRIKLKTICEEFLKLTILISNGISDEIVYKTILLKIFYPSQIPLLKILYTDKNYYSTMLKSEIISNIVTNMWYCEYNWTFNFLNTSSAYKNLTEHFGSEGTYFNPQGLRFKVSKMMKDNQKPAKQKPLAKRLQSEYQDESIDNSMIPMCNIVFNKTKYGGIVGVSNYEINLKQPFSFYKITRFSRDVRMTNHIFSYFFFEKSPAFKVVFEFLVYLIFFSVIISNMFKFSDYRKRFLNYFPETEHVYDGMACLKYGGTPTDIFQKLLSQYIIRNKFANAMAAIGSFQGKGKLVICKLLLPNNLADCEGYDQDVIDVWYYAKIFWILQLYFYLCFIQNIFEMIFTWKKQHKIHFTFKTFIDTLLCAVNIYIHYYYFTYLDDKLYTVQDKLIYHFGKLETILTIFIFIMWFKILNYIKLTKRFGIVMKVIENMTVKLSIFMIVLAIIILAFASICMNLYDRANPQEYGSFFLSVRSLIKLMYGNIDMDNFKDEIVSSSVILNIYTFLIFVLLLNLIIAILSNDFENVTELGGLENAKTLYFNYSLRRPDKYYSILVAMTPPFNLFMILIVPIILFKKNSKINRISTIFGYMLHSIIYFAIYWISNMLIVIPLCYIRLGITLIANLVYKRKNILGFVVWLLWLIISPFYMLWVFNIHDIPLFLKSMYFACPIKDRLDEITKEEIMLIDNQSKILIQNNKEFVSHGELTELIKGDLEKINKKFRRDSLNSQRNKAWNILQTLKGKSAVSMGLATNTEKKENKNYEENVENEINAFVEIDKMEVFSFLRQFNGINGLINLKRLRFLISQINLCKKFNVMKIDKIKQNRLINVLQVVEMLPVEQSVISVMGEQVRNHKIFENVLKKFICF